jgi:hypothetical protein
MISTWITVAALAVLAVVAMLLTAYLAARVGVPAANIL